jgi:hypothetical protein
MVAERPLTVLEARVLVVLRQAGRPCTRAELRLYPELTCRSLGELGTALRSLIAAGLIAPAVIRGVRRACVKEMAAFELTVDAPKRAGKGRRRQ